MTAVCHISYFFLHIFRSHALYNISHIPIRQLKHKEETHRLKPVGFVKIIFSVSDITLYSTVLFIVISKNNFYSVRKATTGSFFAALLEGIKPDRSVNATLTRIRTIAAGIGKNALRLLIPVRL